MSSVVEKIKLEKIRTNGGTQPRTSLNVSTVDEYAEAITDGAKLPPVVVFHDGADYWLADGFHRFFAVKKIGGYDIDAEVRGGTKRDAVLYSVGANASHGLRRTNEDKRKAVMTLLEDAEWSKWSDREIARQCGVSHPFVAAIRNPAVAERQQANRAASNEKKVESDSTRPISPPKAMQAPSSSIDSDDALNAENDEPERDGPSDEELAALEAAEAADREILAKLLDSDDALATAHAEIKRLNALAAGLEQRVNGLLNEKAEAIRLLKKEKNRADRLQKQLDAKVAA